MKNLVKKYPIISGWIQSLPPELLQRCRLVQYSRGENIFQSGTEVEKVYIVCQGNITISNNNVNGNEMCVVVVPQGSSVGEMEVMMQLSHLVYSAKALTDCVLLEVSVSVFRKWIERDHQACQRLAMELARKLYGSSLSTVNYQNLPAQTRLKFFLVDCGVGKILETREQLAEICGVSVRTINRSVVALKEENFLDIVKGKIVLSEEHLKKLTENFLEEI